MKSELSCPAEDKGTGPTHPRPAPRVHSRLMYRSRLRRASLPEPRSARSGFLADGQLAAQCLATSMNTCRGHVLSYARYKGDARAQVLCGGTAVAPGALATFRGAAPLPIRSETATPTGVKAIHALSVVSCASRASYVRRVRSRAPGGLPCANSRGMFIMQDALSARQRSVGAAPARTSEDLGRRASRRDARVRTCAPSAHVTLIS